MGSPELRVRHIAGQQSGVVTRRQALSVGMTDRVIQRRLLDGMWQHLNAGTYLTFGKWSPMTRLAAAIAALPAVVSHESAAQMHGLIVKPSGLPTVTIQHRFSNRFPGVIVHESTDLAPHHVVTVNALPTTSSPRTILDVVNAIGPRALRRLIENSIIRRIVTLDEVRAVFVEVGRRGRPGTAAMRTVLESMTGGLCVPESELERRLETLLREAGLPPPLSQLRPHWLSSIEGRVDFAYADHRLIIECDGRRWHTTQEAFQRDRHRDNLAQIEGWTVLRFTWADVTERPSQVIASIRRVISRTSAWSEARRSTTMARCCRFRGSPRAGGTCPF